LKAFLEKELHLLIQARRLDRLKSSQALDWEDDERIIKQQSEYHDIELLQPTSPTEAERPVSTLSNQSINEKISERLDHMAYNTDSVCLKGPPSVQSDLHQSEATEKIDFEDIREQQVKQNNSQSGEPVQSTTRLRTNSALLRLRANRASFTALPNSVFLMTEVGDQPKIEADPYSYTKSSADIQEQRFRSRLPSLHQKQSLVVQKELPQSISEESSFLYIQEDESVDVVPVRHYDM
jgi:hypothetical protein